jgi:hypothetical protein
MQTRHALQSAALQFGRDGTDRSLADLRSSLATFDRQGDGIRCLKGCPVVDDDCDAAGHPIADLAGETFLSARLDGESHSE